MKCHPEELEEMDLYLESLVEYYESASCERYPKESSNCKIELPIVSKSQHDRPPLPPPLAIDCLGNIKKEVREGCYLNAVTKWNITRRSPIKNVCCATWDNIDCLDQIAKVRCPSAEVSDTEDYFKQVLVLRKLFFIEISIVLKLKNIFLFRSKTGRRRKRAVKSLITAQTVVIHRYLSRNLN